MLEIFGWLWGFGVRIRICFFILLITRVPLYPLPGEDLLVGRVEPAQAVCHRLAQRRAAGGAAAEAGAHGEARCL